MVHEGLFGPKQKRPIFHQKRPIFHQKSTTYVMHLASWVWRALKRSHVTHIKWTMSPIRMSHVTRMNESFHTSECAEGSLNRHWIKRGLWIQRDLCWIKRGLWIQRDLCWIKRELCWIESKEQWWKEHYVPDTGLFWLTFRYMPLLIHRLLLIQLKKHYVPDIGLFWLNSTLKYKPLLIKFKFQIQASFDTFACFNSIIRLKEHYIRSPLGLVGVKGKVWREILEGLFLRDFEGLFLRDKETWFVDMWAMPHSTESVQWDMTHLSYMGMTGSLTMTVRHDSLVCGPWLIQQYTMRHDSFVIHRCGGLSHRDSEIWFIGMWAMTHSAECTMRHDSFVIYACGGLFLGVTTPPWNREWIKRGLFWIQRDLQGGVES